MPNLAKMHLPWDSKDEKSKVTNTFLVTKRLDDFGMAKHETEVPILRIPAIAFLYLLSKAEADGQMKN